MATHLAEEHVDLALVLVPRWHRGRTAGRCPAPVADEDETGHEGEKRRDEQSGLCSLFRLLDDALVPCRAAPVSRCARRLGSVRPLAFRGASWAASRCSGSTSACAFSVSISTARRDCTIFWSAEACARLMSEDTWLCAVLMAASADSTSAGGIDAGDERGVEHHAVARRGGRALLIHVLVDVAQIFAQVVDGDALHHRGVRAFLACSSTGSFGGASKLAMRSRKHGDEIAHHVGDGASSPRRG